MNANPIIYTIGHSNMSTDEFISLLHQYKIKCLVDVRRFASSRKFPHFNQSMLSKSLAEDGIDYVWLGEYLGGYRTNGYETHTQTELFQQGLDKLMELAQHEHTTIMCAEKLYFRCHRRFIADVLTDRNWQVIHILDSERAYPHQTLKLL